MGGSSSMAWQSSLNAKVNSKFGFQMWKFPWSNFLILKADISFSTAIWNTDLTVDDYAEGFRMNINVNIDNIGNDRGSETRSVKLDCTPGSIWQVTQQSTLGSTHQCGCLFYCVILNMETWHLRSRDWSPWCYTVRPICALKNYQCKIVACGILWCVQTTGQTFEAL